jgi:uncharacterized protein
MVGMPVDEILASSSAMRPSRAPAAPRDPYAFIDLARSGRTDSWSAVKGLLKIAFCYVLLSIAAAAAIIWWRDVLPAGSVDVLVLLIVAAAWALGLRGALKSQGRPFLSLVSAEGRLRLARCCLGAGLWLAVSLLWLAGGSLVRAITASGRSGISLGHLSWPHGTLLITTALCLALIPFQAAGEELVFRGWLTQTLGQFLRSRPLLLLIVAAVFALAHGSLHGRYAFPFYLVMWLGLSLLTLWDERLELAIGIHTAQNLLAVIGGAVFAASADRSTILFNAIQVPWWSALVPATQFFIVYLIVAWLERRRSTGCGRLDLTCGVTVRPAER